MKRSAVKPLRLVALAVCLAAFDTAARDITSLSVDAGSGTSTVEFTAGNPGDGHILYYAWSNDGMDKGADIASWPNVVRLCRVADDATGYTFALPSVAPLTGAYSARAFLATTSKNYDNYVTYIETTKAQYIDTGVLANKTTVFAMDFEMKSTAKDQYLIGASGTSSSSISGLHTFAAYINGSGNWAYTCNATSPNYRDSGIKPVTTRTQVRLDANAKQFVVTQGGNTTTKSFTDSSSITTGLADMSLLMFLRRKVASTTESTVDVNYYANLRCYSCSITNNGECVRNYIPAVKDGAAGLYDTIYNTFSPSKSATAFVSSGVTNLTFAFESGDAVAAASPVWPATVAEPPSYVTRVPVTDAENRSFPTGGSKSGAAPLVLSGANNWGGTFVVNEGALIANFGQGLASTDNLVFNGGTYGLCTGSIFNWTIGTGDGETSLGAGAATLLGFTAYGNSFSVVANGNAATPIQFGTASATSFNPEQFVLNDDWATDTVTFKNGITGNNGDSSTPVLKIYSGAADAVIEGAVSGVELDKRGAGTLSLRGANNAFGSIYPRGGTLIIAPPEGESHCNISLTQIYNNTANAGSLVISNATVTQSGSGVNQTWYGGTSVALVGTTWNSTSGAFYPGNKKGTGASARLVLDDSSVKITGGYFYQGNSGSGDTYATCDLILTNNASLNVLAFYGRKGAVHQYGGTTVSVTKNEGGALRIANAGSSTFDWYIHGGSLVQDSAGDSATFSFGMSTEGSSTKGTGSLYIYNGGTFTAKGNSGFLGRYQKDVGNLYVCGGTATMTKEDATLNIGYNGSGTCEVSDGGLLDIQKGSIVAVPKWITYAGRTGTLNVTDGGTVKARAIFSDTTNCTATIVLDGGKVIANTGSTTNGLIYGFTTSVVGVGGAEIDTNGQNKEISQSFTARSGQSAPISITAAELAALPAFTKTGEGTLSLTGANSWLCATCVLNGTLAVASGALPSTTLRLGGGVIDLGGASHTVANLVGSGVVSNGTLTVTGTVWPGVGDSGALKIDSTATLNFSTLGCFVNADGTCGCLEIAGTLSLAGVTIVGESMENKIQNRGLTLVRAASLVGSPTVDASLLDNNVTVSGGALRIGAPAFIIIVR